MKKKELVVELLKKNNGVFYSRQAKELGIPYEILKRLVDEGVIERVSYGMYIDSNYMEDEYLIAQYRCKKGVFSHDTALFFHDLSDRTPLKLTITIPTGYNSRLIKENDKYKFYYIATTLHQLGKDTLFSPYGNEISVYDKERTICDCIIKKESLDRDLVNSAIKQYIQSKDKDINKLLKYAEVFKIRKIIREYIEVLTWT